MLFQTLLKPGSGVDIEQVVCHLREPLDKDRLEQAWSRVAQRHDVLRTRFRWAGVPSPVQEVVSRVRLDFAAHDRAGTPPHRWESDLRRHLEEDRARGFDLAEAPAMRLALFRRSVDEHVLVWSFHHLLLDAQSITQVLLEAFSLYDAGVEGRAAALPSRRRFRDYVEWLRGRDSAADERYWTDRLRGLEGRVPVPAGRHTPRDPGSEPHFGERELQLPPSVDSALRALKRERGVLVNTVAQGAWALLLGCYTGSGEVVFGAVRGGRSTGLEGAEGIVGLLLNTVPARVSLPAEARVIDWLEEIGDRNAALRAHQHAALPDIARWSGLPQGAALFDTLFDYQPQALDAPFRNLGGRWEGRSFRLVQHTGYALTAGVYGEAPLRLQIGYDAVLFDAAAVDRMLGHFASLMEELATDPDRRLGELGLLAEAERRLVLEEWSGTAAEPPTDRCIHHLFEAQVQRTPDAVSVIFGQESLSYRELNARANRLAHHLRRLGVGAEVRVGIRLERGLEMAVSVLGVLKAGGAYVPLDPAYPAERLEYVLADSAAAVLLTREAMRDALAVRPGVKVVSVDASRQEIAAASVENPHPATTSRNLAYVIYTSGSTGAPKGVAVEHRSVVGFTRATVALLGVQPSDRVLQLASPAFDIMVEELFPAWSCGAAAVLVADGLLAPGELAGAVLRHGVTWMDLPAAYWHEWVLHLAKTGGRVPASLRFVIVGGERIASERVADWARTGIPLVHMYGVTEATVNSTAFRLEPEEDGARRPTLPIGRPAANARTYVLDSMMRPVPVGVQGELWIGGSGVARGYLGRPGLTAERFLPDPFSGVRGARLFRTGDRVRWLASGDLEFLGRIDQQVKIRGFRVEPGEIETALRGHVAVRDAAVVLREDEAGDWRLVAYVVGEADAEALRTHLRRSLPEYMVPGVIVALESLPLTSSGKVDRRALPAPASESAQDRYVAPRTPVEEVMAGIWAETLRLERVGARDDFFELGGHSLLAMRVVSRILAVFSVELSVRALFEAPTVVALAERVEALRRAELPVLAPVVPVERGRPLPLSFAQERLWFLDRLEPGSAFYNVPAAWRLGGEVDVEALERALGEIVRRHEALRTTFAEVENSPVQVIAPFGGFTLPVADLSGLAGADRAAEVERRVGEDATRPFDLRAGPLFRAGLLRVGEDEHVLLLGLHHVVSDEWSLGVLSRELSALYGAYRAGGESPLAEPAVQYADYAVWQREQLGGEALARDLAYWRARLSGAPGLLELPTDRPRPAVQTHRGAHEPFASRSGLGEQLRALGRGEGATLFMTVLGAFQVLLGKYGGSEDVVVGSPIAGRTRQEVEGVIGFFVNTLSLRTELEGEASFREVLRRVRAGTLEAYEHQEAPFERVVEELAPERSLSHSPLFQVMFVWEEAERAGEGLPGVVQERVSARSGTSKFDLTLSVAEAGGRLVGELEYSTDLWDRGTAARLLGHLERVLEQVAADPEVRLWELELLGEAERRQVLEEWNATAVEYPSGGWVHQLFEAQAERTPDAVALLFEEETLTYAELNGRADRLAHRLRRLGVRPEVRVGICLERSLEMIVSFLAVIKAGGAYVPLDPTHPAERLGFMLADSGAAVLVTRLPLLDGLPAYGGEVVRMDADCAAIEAGGAGAPAADAAPENAAYVIYTSGSTGTPKGVAVTHGALLNLMHWHRRAFAITGGDRATQLAGPGFDASVWELWPYLVCGAAVHLVADEETRSSPAALQAFLLERGITVAFAPTPMAEALLALEWPAKAPLRLLLTGGDALRGRPREGLPFALVNNYGPTENSVVTTSGVVAPGPGSGRAPAIGRPIDNVRAYVLDARLAPVPVGVPGELCAGGAQVARGYLGRAELTAERFAPDPYGAAGGRLYRTGDRARLLASGELEYLGRMDQQVKVRGFRIEPGEVEAVLRRHAGVAEAAVVARGDASGGTRLVAYVVPAGGEVAAAGLRAHLRAHLPEYMVPSALVPLAALPLTPSGKVDRRALAAAGPGDAAGEHLAPRTPDEEVLAGIYEDVLRVKRVGVEDDFFELGGHSLLATRVVSRVCAVFCVELSVRALFEAPTVAALAERVEALRRAELPVLAPVVPVERGRPLPLSFAQERLWFLDRLEPGSAFYNLPVALRLSGRLDGQVLERALGEIVRRHEALRTTFRDNEDTPVQVIAPFTGFTLPVDNLSGVGEAEVRRLATEDAERPFDLVAGPLFRARLLRLAPGEHVLLLCVHHIVGDGWSLDVLLRELSELYGARREGRESPLPEPAVQYADYAVWQRDQLRGEALDRQLAYWKERLAGAPALLELPVDHPRPAVQTYRGASESFELSGELLERLRALGRREGTTLYMTLLAAFQVLLARYGGSEDVVVGSPVAGRTRREVEELIGLFVNTLVLRTGLGGDPSFRETLRRVRAVTLGAYEHQDVPFEKLVEALQPERSLSRSPLFQVMFILLDADRPGEELPGVEVRRLSTESATSKFDLTLALSTHPGGARGEVEYSTELFERSTVERMLGHLERVLEQVAADAQVRLSELELLGEAERRQVVVEWNRTEAEYPSERCIHQLFEAQAGRTPQAVAVVYEDTTLRYAELNDRANRLAHHLIGLGVGPEVRVGLCLERSAEMVVCILGVLKAGGAYVPLDPGYPSQRLELMLADSGVAVLLTQEELRATLPVPDGVRVVSVDRAWEEIAEESVANPGNGVTPQNLAYVIYTSGSTGKPKGVAVPHRSLVNFLRAMQGAPGLTSRDALLAVTTLSFDIAGLELFLPVLSGARAVIVSRDTASDARLLAQRIETSGATVLQATPATWRMLLADGWSGSARLRALCGGEALDADLVRQLRPRVAELWNLYGPTETTIWSTLHRVEADGVPPIGRPIANTRLYLLDSRLDPVPLGATGELYIAGDGVARGYLHGPERTAERFLPEAFGEAGSRMYRTGDLARYRADGQVEYVGRADFQVKIRGFRIELGEIEASLQKHPRVRQAVVVARDDVPGGRRLVAYLVADGEVPGVGELRQALRESLPEYMVPGAFVAVDALPLTPNGKVDRKSLPIPEYGPVEERHVAPRTPAEEMLAGIWCEVLRVERVGVGDDFFDLGGHSLLAVRVVSRIRKVFGAELTVRVLFENRTIEQLANVLSERGILHLPDPPGHPVVSPASSPHLLLAAIDGLSEEELDRLLGAQS